MKIQKIFLYLFVILLLCGFEIVQAQQYKIPKQKEINKRINYLQRMIDQPLDYDSDIILLGRENHEFMLFSYAFSSYAMTNLAVRDTIYKERAIRLIKESIVKVTDRVIAIRYGVDPLGLKSDSMPNYSVLYLGHLNLMIGCYRLLSADTSFNDLNDRISKSLFYRYNTSKFLNLESYSSSIWIPDNSVAIASLKLHGVNANSGYDSICVKWVKYVKEQYIDKKTGVLCSTINPQTGVAEEEPRGSMLGWSIMFIYQFDSEFANTLYRNYKKQFSKNYLIFRPFKERFQNNKTSMGDIDSGPILYGYSIPANEFALSNAVLSKDFRTARKIERLIKMGTKNIRKNNEFRYKVRFMKMNISPMAEALMLHSMTIVKWTEK